MEHYYTHSIVTDRIGRQRRDSAQGILQRRELLFEPEYSRRHLSYPSDKLTAVSGGHIRLGALWLAVYLHVDDFPELRSGGYSGPPPVGPLGSEPARLVGPLGGPHSSPAPARDGRGRQRHDNGRFIKRNTAEIVIT
ncbi:hypothetical protein GGTG_02529 [Gaeumannomyces tritici R3-111a-1]|uniref:Uncharacterized protein n=1 Tax=Gaeumannomyces tritici (strain R3-111a-1) TaxID=644352 RepID=J3NMM3_GAET3|nr:hypothetical protein GGTG_02529 [Gaeumannomyces tritici R3-111a-1]EJT82556.1 hypothetical protein GGTG_02529 [Gaeumannomyces tritici R3-111a-1]